MMNNEENLKYNNAAPLYEVKKCQSMLELNEIAIIHQLNEDFGDDIVDECYGHVEDEEGGTPSTGQELKCCEQELDSTRDRRKSVDLPSSNGDRKYIRTSTRATETSAMMTKGSTSTVSLTIPEESELLKDDSIPDCSGDCKSTHETMQVGDDYEDMDNSRHSYSLNLGFDIDSLNLNLGKDTKDGLASAANDKKKAGGRWLPPVISDEDSNDCNGDIDVEDNYDQVLLSQISEPYALKLGLGLEEEELTSQAIDPKSAVVNNTNLLCPIPREIEDTTTSLDNNYDDPSMKKKNGSLVKSIKKSVSMLNLSSLRKNKKSIIMNDPGMTIQRYTSPEHSSKPLKSILKKSSPSPSSPDSSPLILQTVNAKMDYSTNMTPSLVHHHPNKTKRVTSFSNIEIREYDITLGDNPGGADGPPISLDWNYNEIFTQVMDVDIYEEHRPPRRTRLEMYMCSSVRSYRLMKEQEMKSEENE